MASVIPMIKESPDQAAARGAQQQTEDALAESFENERSGDLRYDQSHRLWLILDPTSGIWRPDHRQQTLYDIRLHVRRRNPNNEARLGKAAVVLNVELLCRMRDGFSITADQLDADPFILGTPEGPYDLTNAERLDADPDILVTKSTSVAPQFSVPALWLRFLAEATGNDQSLIDYLQRLLGYCLTGSTREEQLTFIWGKGGNGKGTLLGALLDIAGDYARSTSTDTFLETRNDRNKADLAVLAGKRVAVAQESNEGRKWDGQRVKSITGRDEIEARFLYANSFTFKPTFKLVIASNHRPRIPTVDESWRRRLHFLPFDKTPAHPDPRLKEKLRDEYPQILGWLIQGAEWWNREGLMVPDVVVKASDDYLRSEDIVGLWFEECVEVNPDKTTDRKDVANSLKRWCDEMNHRAPTVHALTRWLRENRGIGQDLKNNKRPYVGITLKSDEDFSGGASSAPAPRYNPSADSQDDGHDLPF
jgi:putative DNA primase/helicase